MKFKWGDKMINVTCDRCKKICSLEYSYIRVFEHDFCHDCYNDFLDVIDEFVLNTNQTTGVKQNEQEKASNT